MGLDDFQYSLASSQAQRMISAGRLGYRRKEWCWMWEVGVESVKKKRSKELKRWNKSSERSDAVVLEPPVE